MTGMIPSNGREPLSSADINDTGGLIRGAAISTVEFDITLE